MSGEKLWERCPPKADRPHTPAARPRARGYHISGRRAALHEKFHRVSGEAARRHGDFRVGEPPSQEKAAGTGTQTGPSKRNRI
jgi:hypothetical protein